MTWHSTSMAKPRYHARGSAPHTTTSWQPQHPSLLLLPLDAPLLFLLLLLLSLLLLLLLLLLLPLLVVQLPAASCHLLLRAVSGA
jgi:hypothetical protein